MDKPLPKAAVLSNSAEVQPLLPPEVRGPQQTAQEENPEGQSEDHGLGRPQNDLEQARTRELRAFESIKLLEAEIAELKGELAAITGSLAWKSVIHFRVLKNRAFPPGSFCRKLYDRIVSRHKAPALGHHSVQFDNKAELRSQIPVSIESSPNDQRFLSCSIVVPTFNRAEFTRYCLSAIDRSISFERVPHEIIVVDNGSKDGTPEMLRAWSGRRDNRRIVLMQDNLGFARGCNAGARVARGNFIVFLNNDTLPTPGWLEHMLTLAQNEANVGIVGNKLLFPNERIQHVGIVFDENKNARHIYKGFRADIPFANSSRECQAVTGACLMISKKLFWSLGGMDEAFENSFEDLDLCLKARTSGYRIMVCADSIVYHFEGLTEGRHENELRNRALFKTRWANCIVTDTQRWDAFDSMTGEASAFEKYQGYYPKQESELANLWRRIYSDVLPEQELGAKTSRASTR